jgi:hypothetical protein
VPGELQDPVAGRSKGRTVANTKAGNVSKKGNCLFSMKPFGVIAIVSEAISSFCRLSVSPRSCFCTPARLVCYPSYLFKQLGRSRVLLVTLCILNCHCVPYFERSAGEMVIKEAAKQSRLFFILPFFEWS